MLVKKRGRPKEYYVGKELGWITIIDELNPRNGNRRFITECRECGKKEQVWQTDISTGNYGKCNCEFKGTKVTYLK